MRIKAAPRLRPNCQVSKLGKLPAEPERIDVSNRTQQTVATVLLVWLAQAHIR